MYKTTGDKMKLSIVIPCYGSEMTIKKVIDEIEETVQQREMDYEVILVNDNSPDHVWEVIKSLSSQNSHIKGISFCKNFGQHSALMAGYRACSGDIVLSMDDDGQTPATEMLLLIDKIKEGYDVVYAYYEKKKHSTFRNFGSKLNDFMSEKLMEKPKTLKISSYFAAKKYIIDEICKYHNPYCYIQGLILRTTKNIGNVSINHRQRMQGESGYNLKKLINLWMNGFTAFSVKPLRIATMMGCSLAIVGFIYVIYIIVKHFISPVAPIGWSSAIASILIVGGMILCVLGMIGEYLGRVYISLNDAPQYVIKETTEDDK